MYISYYKSQGSWFWTPPLEYVSLVKDILEVLPHYLLGFPSKWELNFDIDVLPHMKPI